MCVCGCQVVVKSNNSTLQQDKKACAWRQRQHQRTIVSDTRLTPDARHIKDTENATTSLRESVLVDSQNTDKANNQPRNSSCYMARVFSFSQEALINLMGALVRRTVAQHSWWEKNKNKKSSVECFDLCLSHVVEGYTVYVSVYINLVE